MRGCGDRVVFGGFGRVSGWPSRPPGTGRRLLTGAGPATGLRLTRHEATPSGLLLLEYEVTGPAPLAEFDGVSQFV
ncbi:hypothetical protein [Nocardia sp. NPDC002869]|uniref:hypothetical protein n=1 Tax=Nocardia sp. NPDC002869 TaxID=3161032 RepID=UPI00398C950F